VNGIATTSVPKFIGSTPEGVAGQPQNAERLPQRLDFTNDDTRADRSLSFLGSQDSQALGT
jgi:hypothetical protein